MDIKLTEKQSLVFTTDAKAIMYGGSLGSGKTFLNKILSISACMAVPKLQVLILRQNYPQLKANYMIGEGGFPDLLKDFVTSGICSIRYSTMDIVFNNGAQISMRYLDNEASLNSIQGAEYQIIIADEGSQLKPEHLAYTRTRLRMSTLKIEDEFWRKKLPMWLVSTNPGNVGHEYLKRIFIDPSPPGKEFEDEYGIKTIFIPAFITDNPYLNAEEYIKQIKATGDETLVKQLLEGSWDSLDGAFFKHSFRRDKNVIPYFKPKESWKLRRGMDHGYSSPFCVLWAAEVMGENEVTLPNGKEIYLPNGSFVFFDEFYGSGDPKDRNIGNRFSATEIAVGIKKREEEMGLQKRIRPGPADNSIFAHLSEKSVADEMRACGVTFTTSDKSPGSRARGWAIMSDMLKNAHIDGKIEKPCLLIMENCVNLIADITTLPVSKKSGDDVDTTAIDHAADAARYIIATPPKQAGFVKTSGL